METPAPPAELGSPDSPGEVSPQIRAPRRFNLVGFEWDGEAEPAIAVRVRGAGEPWGRWTPVAAEPDGGPDPESDEEGTASTSQPVWAGQADYLQYRVSKRPPNLRLHLINSTGTATPGDRVKTGVRGAVNDVAVAIAGLPSAIASHQKPDMISRRRWGAEEHCVPRRDPSEGTVKAGFIHHTVNANSYSRDEALSMVLGICRYHRNVNGWDDMGYNFLVDRFGRLYTGRAGGSEDPVVGAHAQGFNSQSTGIAALGTHGSTRLSDGAVAATARLIRWKFGIHGIPVTGKVTLVSGGGETNRYPRGTRVRLRRTSGHRDVSPTSCPGQRLYDQIPAIRRRAE
jgi:N-acetylmuramoyl-L-alanine amidase